MKYYNEVYESVSPPNIPLWYMKYFAPNDADNQQIRKISKKNMSFSFEKRIYIYKGNFYLQTYVSL